MRPWSVLCLDHFLFNWAKHVVQPCISTVSANIAATRQVRLPEARKNPFGSQIAAVVTYNSRRNCHIPVIGTWRGIVISTLFDTENCVRVMFRRPALLALPHMISAEQKFCSKTRSTISVPNASRFDWKSSESRPTGIHGSKWESLVKVQVLRWGKICSQC